MRIEANEWLPEDLDAPDWDSGGRVHNWRNHVGDETQKIGGVSV